MGNVFKTVENKGKFVQGKLSGLIRVEYANGDSFEGEYRDGKKNGKGVHDYKTLQNLSNSIMSMSDESGLYNNKYFMHLQPIQQGYGAIYTGNFKRDLREGQGTIKFLSDNTYFTGEWKLDQKHFGILSLPNGSLYKGPFQNDLFHGKGKLTITVQGNSRDSKLVKEFTGLFQFGQIPSEGKLMVVGNDEYYLGQVNGDYEKHGYGYLIKPGVWKYEGSFSEDKKDGFALQLYENGSYYIHNKTLFRKNSFVSINRSFKCITQVLCDIGQWVQDKEQGMGRYYETPHGLIYEGQWEKGQKSGDGILTDPRKGGTVLKGVWRQGKLDGKTEIREQGGYPFVDAEVLFGKVKGGIKSVQEAFRIPEKLRVLMQPEK